MSKFPEYIQFRAAPGTSTALEAIATAEGKRSAEIIREAVAERLRVAAEPDRRAA